MRTPSMHTLAVPSSILAFLITSEFNRQDKFLKTGEMPILGLCRTAVDADLEGNITHYLQSTILEYLKTDTLNFYDDIYKDEYEKIAKPLLVQFSKDFNMEISPSSSLQAPKVEVSQEFLAWMKGLNNWKLIGLETMTVWLKSTICAYSMIKGHDFETVQFAATLEQVIQMNRNGVVQEKLMNLNQIRVMVSSGLMVYQHGELENENPTKS